MRALVLGVLLVVGGVASSGHAAAHRGFLVSGRVTHYDLTGLTATGTYTTVGRTAACGPSYVDDRITLFDDAGGAYTFWCEDTGGGVYDGLFDLYWPGGYWIDATWAGGALVEVD